ncbi:MAG TPA: hypothetical protein VJ728_09625 [Candidatus Binataceae bacterium]|nr:hypothetical protein [Candidatus Binataceae bacterium]
MRTSEFCLRADIDSFSAGFSFILRICEWELVAIFVAALVLSFPSVLLAQTKPASFNDRAKGAHTASSDSLVSILTARGLLGNTADSNSSAIEPPSGTEVDETIQTAKQDGKKISHTREWTEKLNSNALHIELTSFPGKQSQVAFWVLPDQSQGCLMFGRTMFDANGRPLHSEFWRNDRQLKITGAADFPPDLYPEALPAVALLRVVDFSRQGAKGKIDQQVSPYGFVDQQVTVKESDDVQVPAGRFEAVRVDSQPNVSSILPSWPRFTLGVVSPFLPQTTYYFQAGPPHRLLRKEQAGTPFIGGPEAVTELLRYYVAGTTASNSPTHQLKGSTG